MPVTYELRLDDQKGNEIATLDLFQSLNWTRTENAVGTFSVRFARENFDPALFEPRRRLEIMRKPQDSPAQLIMVGFLLMIDRKSVDGSGTVTLGGLDANYLIPGRIVASDSGTAGAEESGPADDVMKAYVREALGSLAAAGRDETAGGFSVQADLSQAPTVEKEAARRDLLLTLQELANSSKFKGTRLYFDVVHPTPSTFQFRTYTGQRGQDRTQASGVNPIELSKEAGTLRNPNLVEDWREEANFIYGGGVGTGATRPIVTAQDDTRISQSIFGRREAFFNGSNYKIPAALQAATEARLEQGRPKRRFTAELVDSEFNRFGRDWGFGDRVTALFEDRQIDVDVAAVQGTFVDGKETIMARLEHVD